MVIIRRMNKFFAIILCLFNSFFTTSQIKIQDVGDGWKTSVNSAIYPTDYYAEMLLAQPKVLARFNTQFTFVPYDYEGNETTDTAEEVSYTV